MHGSAESQEKQKLLPYILFPNSVQLLNWACNSESSLRAAESWLKYVAGGLDGLAMHRGELISSQKSLLYFNGIWEKYKLQSAL